MTDEQKKGGKSKGGKAGRNSLRTFALALKHTHHDIFSYDISRSFSRKPEIRGSLARGNRTKIGWLANATGSKEKREARDAWRSHLWSLNERWNRYLEFRAEPNEIQCEWLIWFFLLSSDNILKLHIIQYSIISNYFIKNDEEQRKRLFSIKVCKYLYLIIFIICFLNYVSEIYSHCLNDIR